MTTNDSEIQIINKLKNKKIALWGAGKNMKRRRDFICEYIMPQICVDRDKSLWGEEILPGVKCVSPDSLADFQIDVIVITLESRRVANSIAEEIGSAYEVYTLDYILDEIYMNLPEEAFSWRFGEESDKIKHFTCDLGSCACNLKCSYCYLDFGDTNFKFNNDFTHSIPVIIKALSRKRLGGRAYLSLYGSGETLLKPGFIELAYGLLEEGHYLCIITNGTITDKLERLLDFPKEMRERIYIAFSMHYLELKKQNKLNVFFDNVNLMRRHEISVNISLLGADACLPYRDEIKRISLEKVGFLPVIGVVKKDTDYNEGFPLDSEMNWEEYKEAWKDFGSRPIEIRDKTLGKINQLCYAGMSSGRIILDSGDILSCVPGNYVDNIYNDITKKIQFYEKPHYCDWGFCSCCDVFLSGRIIDSVRIPKYSENHEITDSDGRMIVGEEMRKAMDFCCDY